MIVPDRSPRDQRLGFGAGPIMNVKRITRDLDMAGHMGAHHAEANKSNRRFHVSHSFFLAFFLDPAFRAAARGGTSG